MNSALDKLLEKQMEIQKKNENSYPGRNGTN